MTNEQVWIVITTINPPTKAVKEFARMASEKKWKVLVVGDTKTPADWNCDGVEFLSIDRQRAEFGEIANLVPVKHYCRKNIGYLYAIQNGATILIDTDDDNLPYTDFAARLEKNVTGEVIGGEKWANIYSYYSEETIWPRGLPLNHIHTKGAIQGSQERDCLVQQYLADEDPDVDAIFRLIVKKNTRFNKTGKSYIIGDDTYVPFNSQNTVFFKEAFILMYLPCFVSFRMTDIWRSFVVQRLLRHMKSNLSFHDATVWQERNQHDLMKDFNDEVIGYTMNDTIIRTIDSVNLEGAGLKDAIMRVWNALFDIKIVNEEELKIIRVWLSYFK